MTAPSPVMPTAIPTGSRETSEVTLKPLAPAAMRFPTSDPQRGGVHHVIDVPVLASIHYEREADADGVYGPWRAVLASVHPPSASKGRTIMWQARDADDENGPAEVVDLVPDWLRRPVERHVPLVRRPDPIPENVEQSRADYSASQPVTDYDDERDWSSRLYHAAGLLERLGRHSNTYRVMQALRRVANHLGPAGNPDERDAILRALVRPSGPDDPVSLNPRDLSWSYPEDASTGDIGTGVRVEHRPTGLYAWSTTHPTRAGNSAAAAVDLAYAVDARTAAMKGQNP